MCMHDPISDMLTRIRNACSSGKESVSMPSSKIKRGIAEILYREGYIKDFSVTEDKKPVLNISLKYYRKRPVIEEIRRISLPSRRYYTNVSNMQSFTKGLGMVIISTSKGIMTDSEARRNNLGGEVICHIS